MMEMPFVRKRIFDDKFTGIEIFIPAEFGCAEIYEKAKIIDNTHYSIGRRSYTIDEVDIPEKLQPFTLNEAYVFNDKYYTPESWYINYESGAIFKLLSCLPTTLVFDIGDPDPSNVYRVSIDNLYEPGRAYHSYRDSEKVKIWLKLSENKYDSLVSLNTPAISRDKIVERVDSLHQIYLFDKTACKITDVEDIDETRKFIRIGYNNYVDIEKDFNNYKLYRLSKTKSGMRFKEIKIPDLYSEKHKGSFNIPKAEIDEFNRYERFNAIGYVIKRKDDKYFAAFYNDISAERLHAFPSCGREEYNEYEYIYPEDVEEIYTVDLTKPFHESRNILNLAYKIKMELEQKVIL